MKRVSLIVFWLSGFLLTMTWCGVAHATRLALVIGNDGYVKVPALDNARADARAMSAALRKAGFEVELAEDQGRAGMNRALRKFRSKIAGGDEVVLFFAGHGVELRGSNYLLPIDIDVEDEESIKHDAVGLQEVLDEIQQRQPRFTLVIMDACRDNPFRGMGRNVGEAGLKPVVAATGQMVIYSAGAGQRALDRLNEADTSPNGLFTRVFVAEMLRATEPVQLTVARVRREVSRLAQKVGHNQVPALYDQSIGEFRFTGGSARNGGDGATDEAGIKDTERDEAYWGEVKSLNTVTAYRAYKSRFPHGIYAALADAAIEKIEHEASRGKSSTPGVASSSSLPEDEASAGGRSQTKPDPGRQVHSSSARPTAPSVDRQKGDIPTNCDLAASSRAGVSRLKANSNLVQDEVLGLVWMRCSVGQKWHEAAGCIGDPGTFTFDRARKQIPDGWRVPTKEELLSIVAHYCRDPWIDQSIFPNAAAARYWTSTKDRDGCWTIDFSTGKAFTENRGHPDETLMHRFFCNSRYAVRLVRDAERSP